MEVLRRQLIKNKSHVVFQEDLIATHLLLFEPFFLPTVDKSSALELHMRYRHLVVRYSNKNQVIKYNVDSGPLIENIEYLLKT